MDRTSRIGVFVCLALLAYIWWFANPLVPPKLPAAKPVPTPSASAPSAPATSPAGSGSAPPVLVAEKLSFLENDSIKATLTSRGAAIEQVELKKHKEGAQGNVVLNEQAQDNILQPVAWLEASALNFAARSGPDSVTYTAALPDGVAWTRTYTLGGDYTLKVTDTFANPGSSPATLPAYGLSVGRAEPLHGDATVGRHFVNPSAYLLNSNRLYLGSGWLTNKGFHLVTIGNFNPGSIPLIGIKTSSEKDLISSTSIDPNPLRWLGVENQFFTVLLTPAEDHLIDHAQFQCFNVRDANGQLPPGADPEIEATAFFPGVTVAAHQSVTYPYTVYAGPKSYDRLNSLGEQQGELMNYGRFEVLILPMLWLLRKFDGVVGNYGVAIILLTLCIKIITWPLQSYANRAGKRMQAVGPKIKELQAKYKEQPEKLNTETFALYKEYGVNPFGGCLPALVQMPIFFSLYFMLQNAVELRGQKFLWVHDLTRPDTIAVLPFLGHLALNPLPLMVTGLTMVMMRMTPQLGDPQQAKIAQFMPLVFLFIFYNFAAGLSLYYVINNCVSIVQIYRNLRKPLPELKRQPKKKAA